jgi:polar amino acid transport system substrate-binding protein
MRKLLKRLVGALAIALLVSAAAQADQLSTIREKGELVCGVLGTDEPNSFVDPQTRTIIGYEVDLCRAIAKKIGVRLTIKQLAVAARIPELQQGRVDILAAALTHTREREAVVDFSLTTFVTGQRVMVRKDSGITQLSQLAGKRVVTVRGGTQEPNMRRAVPTVQMITFETAPQALVALEQRKAVGFVNDEVSLLDAWGKLGPRQENFRLLDQSISTEALALGLRKSEPAFKKVVDDTLRELEKSGEAERLFMYWYGPQSRLKYDKRHFRIETDKLPGTTPLDLVLSGEFGKWLLNGFVLSIELTLITLVFAFPLAAFIALLRLSPWKPLRGLGFAYVEGIRNVPLLAHLMFWYFGATQLLPEGARAWLYQHGAETVCAIVALTLYTAAFMAEDVRSGIRSISSTQIEAARALGFGYLPSMQLVVLPQAVRVTVPPLISQTLNLWKNTSIATVIGTAELMYQAQRVETATFRGAETFAITTAAYLVVSALITLIGVLYQRRFPVRAA